MTVYYLRSTSRSCRSADSLVSESDARTAWGSVESSNQPVLGIQLRVSWEETSSEDTWYTCHDTLVIHGSYLGVSWRYSFSSLEVFLHFPWFSLASTSTAILASQLYHEFQHPGWLWLLINIFGFGFQLWWLGLALMYTYNIYKHIYRIYIYIYIHVKKQTGIYVCQYRSLIYYESWTTRTLRRWRVWCELPNSWGNDG